LRKAKCKTEAWAKNLQPGGVIVQLYVNCRMKYFILIFIIVIVASLGYKYFFADDLPAAFVIQINNQRNPFAVPKDSNQVVWKRARQFLADKRWLIDGSPVRETDSSLYVPYYNKDKKGASIKIESTKVGDSVVFTTYFWNYQTLNEGKSKEMALFMNKGISKHNFQ
jgi:hypothetical protein